MAITLEHVGMEAGASADSTECEARMKNGMFVFVSTISIVAIVVGTIHEDIGSFNLCPTRVGGMMGEDDSQC